MEERNLTGPVGDILIVSESGEPVASGKKLDDFDPAGSAQAVRSEMWEHVGNEVIHIDTNEREGWNGKAARAVGCKAGNLAALDPQGNPTDSNIAPGNVLLGSDLELHNANEEAHLDIRTALANKADTEPLVWHDLVLQNGITSPRNRAQYCRYNGVVYLRGGVQIPKNSPLLVIATLPKGFRPGDNSFFLGSVDLYSTAASCFARFNVSMDGTIRIVSLSQPNYDFIYFINFSFPAQK